MTSTAEDEREKSNVGLKPSKKTPPSDFRVSSADVRSNAAVVVIPRVLEEIARPQITVFVVLLLRREMSPSFLPHNGIIFQRSACVARGNIAQRHAIPSASSLLNLLTRSAPQQRCSRASEWLETGKGGGGRGTTTLRRRKRWQTSVILVPFCQFGGGKKSQEDEQTNCRTRDDFKPRLVVSSLNMP